MKKVVKWWIGIRLSTTSKYIRAKTNSLYAATVVVSPLFSSERSQQKNINSNKQALWCRQRNKQHNCSYHWTINLLNLYNSKENINKLQNFKEIGQFIANDIRKIISNIWMKKEYEPTKTEPFRQIKNIKRGSEILPSQDSIIILNNYWTYIMKQNYLFFNLSTKNYNNIKNYYRKI